MQPEFWNDAEEAQKVLKDVRGIAFSQFLSEDVVRHPLVQKIINAYERYDSERHAQPNSTKPEASRE